MTTAGVGLASSCVRGGRAEGATGAQNGTVGRRAGKVLLQLRTSAGVAWGLRLMKNDAVIQKRVRMQRRSPPPKAYSKA